EMDDADAVRQAADRAGMNFRYRPDGTVNVALDETSDLQTIDAIVDVFASRHGLSRKPDAFSSAIDDEWIRYPAALQRTSPFLTHPVFNTYHSETEMMRFLRRLERKDIGLDTAMIPLGSCTMKLNAASGMLPLTWPKFAALHPFVPHDQAE